MFQTATPGSENRFAAEAIAARDSINDIQDAPRRDERTDAKRRTLLTRAVEGSAAARRRFRRTAWSSFYGLKRLWMTGLQCLEGMPQVPEPVRIARVSGRQPRR